MTHDTELDAMTRKLTLEECARLVENFRAARPGDKPLLLLDVKAQIAAQIRALK